MGEDKVGVGGELTKEEGDGMKEDNSLVAIKDEGSG